MKICETVTHNTSNQHANNSVVLYSKAGLTNILLGRSLDLA